MTTNYDVRDFIGVFPNIISKLDCDKFIQFFEEQHSLGYTFDRKKYSPDTPLLAKKDYSYSDMQKCFESGEVFMRYSEPGLFKPILARVYECWKTYAEHHYDVLTTLAPVGINPAVKIQKTTVGGGYHVWHCENGSVETGTRVAAFTLYLNDVEEGGETEYLYQHRRVPAKAGTLCIFPSSYTHTHRGNTPLSNDKYIITSWFEFLQ